MQNVSFANETLNLYHVSFQKWRYILRKIFCLYVANVLNINDLLLKGNLLKKSLKKNQKTEIAVHIHIYFLDVYSQISAVDLKTKL